MMDAWINRPERVIDNVCDTQEYGMNIEAEKNITKYEYPLSTNLVKINHYATSVDLGVGVGGKKYRVKIQSIFFLSDSK